MRIFYAIRIILITIGLAVMSMVSTAAILFNPEHNAIMISDYPEALPCGLKQIAVADQMYGWNKVEYDAESDTYTIDCDLWIGNDSGADTYFQIGSAMHPRETLVMRGNLLVRPWWIAGRHPTDKWYRVPERERPVNRLTAGCRDNTTVAAIIRLDCQGTNQIMLATGCQPAEQADKGKHTYGGELHVHNSSLELVNPASGNTMLRNLKLRGPFQRIINSTLTGWGTIYGLSGMTHYENRVERTAFRKCERVIMGGLTFTQCLFEGCGTALADWGSGAEAIDCVFKNNDQNYALGYCKRLLAVDCELGAARKGDTIIVRREEDRGKKSPAFVCRRHVAVSVLDESGNPVESAIVKFTPDQSGSGLMDNLVFKTDATGKTSILLTEYIKTASDTPDHPSEIRFTYAISAEKEGRYGRAIGIAPDTTGKQIKITLEENQ